MRVELMLDRFLLLSLLIKFVLRNDLIEFPTSSMTLLLIFVVSSLELSRSNLILLSLKMNFVGLASEFCLWVLSSALRVRIWNLGFFGVVKPLKLN